MTWEEALRNLSDDVSAYAKASGLHFGQGSLSKRWNPQPGRPIATIKASGHVRFYLEPAEFAGKSLPATVWFFAYPSMRRVRLVGPVDGRRWGIASSDGIPFHQDLSQTSFDELVFVLKQRAA